MKILMIGDVVGSPGRKIFEREVPRLRKDRGIDAVVVLYSFNNFTTDSNLFLMGR